MVQISVLIEVQTQQDSAFGRHSAALASEREALTQTEAVLEKLTGMGLQASDFPPVPLFSPEVVGAPSSELVAHGEPDGSGFVTFSTSNVNDDVPSEAVVVAADVDGSRLEELRGLGVKVWPNSKLSLYEDAPEPAWIDEEYDEIIDAARSRRGLDCRPFRSAVPVRTIRHLLGAYDVWRQGFRGQNVVVGIIDEGVNGDEYPVEGGYSHAAGRLPGSASITSHGSMCAADVLVAAPAATIYDYPFLGVPDSGGALRMFQAVLDQRRMDGTPHLTSNSYGFVGVPSQDLFPNHEIWDIDHPLHRKVREVVTSGAPTFFAAGNCGADCPSSQCFTSGIGPDKSIHASNSLEEVITVAAVNSRHERIGYSSQGEGMFHPQKPDLAAYSHFFGNFGPGRPGGRSDSFDSGTSAATPVAAGVAALLLSAIPDLTPLGLKTTLESTATGIGADWNADLGHGIINASAAYSSLVH